MHIENEHDENAYCKQIKPSSVDHLELENNYVIAEHPSKSLHTVEEPSKSKSVINKNKFSDLQKTNSSIKQTFYGPDFQFSDQVKDVNDHKNHSVCGSNSKHLEFNSANDYLNKCILKPKNISCKLVIPGDQTNLELVNESRSEELLQIEDSLLGSTSEIPDQVKAGADDLKKECADDNPANSPENLNITEEGTGLLIKEKRQ